VSTNPDTLHALGLSEFLLGDRQGIALDRSIYYLQTASRLSDRPATALSDLAVALLVRAGRDQQPRDLLEAIEAADSAVALEPGNAAAWHVLAVSLDWCGLDSEATRAWHRYLALDDSSGWAGEARQRVMALGATVGLPRRTPAKPETVVRADPAEAERMGWDEVLGDWGRAMLQGDTLRAADRLRYAWRLGASLERAGGDRGLADAVREIRRRGASALGPLARAHLDYAAGRSAKTYAEARRRLSAAALSPAASPPLRTRARVFLAIALIYEHETEAGERVLRQLIADVDTVRYPSVAAKARWSLANTLQVGGEFERSLPLAGAAERLYARTSQRMNAGMMQLLAGTGQHGLGAEDAALEAVFRAVTTLRPYRRSIWLHDALHTLATIAAENGLARAVLRLTDEDVVVAERIGPSYAAEARLTRARLRTAVGDTGEVKRDLGAAAAIIAGPDAGSRPAFLRAVLQLTDAQYRLRVGLPVAPSALDSAVRELAGNPTLLVPALLTRADAWLANDAPRSARRDLRRIADVIDAVRSETESQRLRASVMDAGRPVFDRLIVVDLAQGDTLGALLDLERARVVARSPRRRPRAAQVALPPSRPGETVAVYTQIGDALLVWTVTGGAVTLTRTVVPAERLRRMVEEARTALELREPEQRLRPRLSALHAVLVAPLRRGLGPRGSAVAIVADGVLEGIPFAALYDPARSQYLVRDHPLRSASGLREASSPPAASAASTALLVNPAFDAGEFPDLPPLSGAAAEVQEVARLYPASQVLVGPGAGPDALKAAAAGTEMLHYAGHAVADDHRPERSYLVLAGNRHSGRLSAGEIERLDLHRVRLVVLSACQTARRTGGRASGLTGLAGAFQAAGARGVVAGLWRVDDADTRVLMIEFHRRYRASGNAVTALNAAQVALLDSPRAELRSPAAWAGFRYTGP
jgi:CHAT domain-containing protein